MAYTFDRPQPTRLALRPAIPLGTFVNRLTAWNNARRTRNVLSQLSAHELSDIGLSRGDVDTIGRRGF